MFVFLCAPASLGSQKYAFLHVPVHLGSLIYTFLRAHRTACLYILLEFTQVPILMP